MRSEHKLRLATGQYKADSGLHDTNRALEDVLGTIAKAPRLAAQGSLSLLRQNQILERLASHFSTSEVHVRERLTSLRKNSRPREQSSAGNSASAAPLAALDPWERRLLELAIVAPELLPRMREEFSPEQLTSPSARAILTCSYEWYGASSSLFDHLLVEFDEPELKSLLVDLDERGRAKGGTEAAAELDLLLAARRNRADQVEQRRGMSALASKRVDEDAELEILRQICERERSRQGISVPTDG